MISRSQLGLLKEATIDQALQRIFTMRLRLGEFDVLVGINLLREGLDIPEVALVAVLDADKEGFLRNHTSLVQTIGRAARNVDGRAILYADKVTKSIRSAMGETERRRDKQREYNLAHGITPETIRKSVESPLAALLDAMVHTGAVPAVCGSDPAIRADAPFVLDLVKVCEQV